MPEQDFLYLYDFNTKELLSKERVLLSPLDNKPLMPSDTTLVAPPSDIPSGHVAVFDPTSTDGREGSWTTKVDNRNTVYYTADGTKITITELGISPPTNALTEPPDLRTDDEIRKDIIIAIKAKAESLILPIYPIYTQTNLIRQLANGGTWTQEVIDNFTEIDRIRTVSDTMEAGLNSLNRASLLTYDPELDSHWTAP